MATEVDPFTQVFSKLWDLLADDAGFRGMVREGNRIRFDDSKQRDPIKQSVITNDMPEVMITSEGTTEVKLMSSSCSSKVIRRYNITLNSADFRIHEVLYPLEWAVLCAMLTWRTALTQLTWKGKSFVKRTDIVEVREGQSDETRNRGIRGWTAVWGCEVEMHFATADLRST